MNNLDEFEKALGYKFNNKKLLQVALTHSSYGNEHNCEYNERMEFLGDAVLELAMSKYLYNVISLDEGVLTKQRAKAVCEPALDIYAKKLNLPKYLNHQVEEIDLQLLQMQWKRYLVLYS